MGMRTIGVEDAWLDVLCALYPFEHHQPAVRRLCANSAGLWGNPQYHPVSACAEERAAAGHHAVWPLFWRAGGGRLRDGKRVFLAGHGAAGDPGHNLPRLPAYHGHYSALSVDADGGEFAGRPSVSRGGSAH
ncbi:hypothetical protein BBAD15_g10895 [Beauveria bassiana D1-5]|uniref:Uncharacterized protein n=1 Tax=Beauveria bassiana D1-5 TaxID=1245745 RepID=A0A0A2VSU7_BEABA|nr:hypothetical protein BBAD15_g10895 [Beauveria bassiana D1-5]